MEANHEQKPGAKYILFLFSIDLRNETKLLKIKS